MKKIASSILVLFFCISALAPLEGLLHFQDIYPETVQTLELIGDFAGDRHGAFRGDLVAKLSDGSEWKVHPENRDSFSRWCQGDVVRVMARTDWYWFKREHKFSLYNYNTNESVKVMIVAHKLFPESLRIASVDYYYGGYTYVPVTETVTIYHDDGSQEAIESTHWETRLTDQRKVLISFTTSKI